MRVDAEHADRRFTQTQESYAADDLETMKDARRYSAHIFNLLVPHIGARVLEVGAGIGTMTQRLADTSEFVLAVEPNPHCRTRLRQAVAGHPKVAVQECHLEECDPNEIQQHRFDTVVCVNVLEHIADDVAALRTFRESVVPGGHVLIFVPAVQLAYGPLDAELGHHRRYSKRTLAGAFATAGLDLATIRYTNPIGLFGWMYNAHVTKSTAHSPRQVKLFDALVAPWALPLERAIEPPLGLSLIAVGRRP